MKTSTAIVVTLIPPAVEAEPPPINISRSIPNQVAGSIWDMSTEFKPPDLGITEANMVFTNLSQVFSPPRVPGLFHSMAPINRAPITSSVTVIQRVRRV